MLTPIESQKCPEESQETLVKKHIFLHIFTLHIFFSEKIVRNRITSFWHNLDVINKNQFGFLQGRSTTTQLLSTIHDFAKSRNSSFATDVIFLDLAKAFDSVPHERLLNYVALVL